MLLDKEKYNTIKEEVVKHSKAYQNEAKVEQFVSHIANKLQNFKPTVMVYGTYNAGKSTLINALFGKEELAKTGDSPETYAIKDYEYNGFTIYDTPGINAPIEHEDITNEQLKKTELVLFVLSNDGSLEEKYIYQKISDIVEMNKPILIVVNNKAGIEKDSIEEKEQYDKINLNLSKIGDKKGIESIELKVNICMVNAKVGLKGKIENKKLLLKKSNMEQLEYEINNLLSQSGSNEVENALNLFIQDYINETISIIDARIGNPEMKKVQQNITYLEQLKQRTNNELQNVIQESVIVVSNNLLELFLQKDQNAISTFIDKAIKDVQEILNKKIKSVYDEISSKVENFNKEFQELSLQTGNLDTSLDIEQSSNGESDNSNNLQVKTATLASAAAAINIVPPVIVVGPVPIPARLLAQMALAFFSVFSSSDAGRIKAEAQLEAKRSQHLAAKNKADEFGFDYKNKLLTSTEESLNNLFDPTIKNLMQIAQQLQIDNDILLQDKQFLQQVLSQLV